MRALMPMPILSWDGRPCPSSALHAEAFRRASRMRPSGTPSRFGEVPGEGARLAFATFILLCLAFLLVPSHALASTPAAKAVHTPKVELSVYRRSYTTDENVVVRLSAYNVHRVAFSLYRVDLATLVPNSTVLQDFGKSIATVPIDAMRPAKSFAYAMGKIYPDQWDEREVKTPRLAPGAYLIAADGAGAKARTWFAVTNISLVAKRSLQEVLVYATDARSGKPIPGLDLNAVDSKGNRLSGSTGTQGIWRAALKSKSEADGMTGIMADASSNHNPNGKPLPPPILSPRGHFSRAFEHDMTLKSMPTPAPTATIDGNLWIEGAGGGQPAFVLAGAPPSPPPFTVYAYTDRPIYRPSQKVEFKGIIRDRLEGEAPGGFVYKTYAEKPVSIEIRDATDALIYRKHLTTNKFGSFDGELALGPEPPLGKWQLVIAIGDFRSYAGFDVQEYRKPEYTTNVTFDKPHYLGGDKIHATIGAKYFFGGAVTGATVHYNVNFAGGDRVEPNYEADAVTDSNGEVKIEIPTKHLPGDRSVSISATVTDLSRRQIQANGSAQIYSGLFTLSLDTDKSFYRPGDTVDVTVTSTDHDGKPVHANVKVSLVETLYDNKHRPYEERTTRTVDTSASTGTGAAMFKPKRPGEYQLEAVATDTRDNTVASTDGVWIAGDDDPDYDYPSLDLKTDKDAYVPGQTATIALNTNLVTTDAERRKALASLKKGEPAPAMYGQTWALITVQGERLYKHFVVSIKSKTTTFTVPLVETYFPSVEISAVIVQERHIYEQQVIVNVERKEQKLTVDIAPDKSKYAPADSATYTVTTHDWKGRPVAAEVSLGIVDSSIYAIEPDSTPSIESSFYAAQEVRVQTDFSFAAQYSGGAYQTVPRPMALPPGLPGQPGIRVRKQFADTACWSPFVTTGPDGIGHVTFTMPDNLTSWRATARGVTQSTQVGESTNEVTSSMPLMVRLEQPRFYVQGDDTIVSAIVHNYTGATRTVDVKLDVDGLEIIGDSEQKLEIPNGAEKRLDWKAHVTGHPTKSTTQAQPTSTSPSPVPTGEGAGGEGLARLTVTADGGPGAQDATESTLKVLPDGLKMYEAKSYVFNERGGSGSLDLTKLPAGAKVTLTLAPSVASSMFDALDYLTDYPYGCAEQTMSALMPDVFVGRSLHRLHVDRKLHADPDKLVNFGLQKLYRYQHPDGGWHWWESDQSDPEMTAYVLWGLCQARDAGYTVDDQRIVRGAACLANFVSQTKDPSDKAEYLLALACADPNAAAKPLLALYDKRADLDTYGLASLSLALRQAGGKLLPKGNQIARDLEDQAKNVQNFSYWATGETGYTWHADTVFVTAHVLRAVLAARSHADIVPRVVAWLMAQKTGNAWNCTRTSAEVVYALSQYMETTTETHPHYTAKVTLDGDVVKTVEMTDASVFADPNTITLTPAQLAGHKSIDIARDGSGVLYATAGISYTIAAAAATPRNDGLAVTRNYQVSSDDPSKADVVDRGLDIPVHVDIKSDTGYPYVMLEEPIPASCEVSPDEDNPYGYGGRAYSRREVHDDRIVFFFDDIAAGHTKFDYTLRTESPGSYRILPGIAALVYHPELRGNTGLARVNVRDQLAGGN